MQRQKQIRSPRFILGITGSFSSGKTTVSRIFGSFGAEIIDADRLAHRGARLGTAVYKKIIAAFGRGILKGDKTIHRRRLAGLVFNRKDLLKRLNSIIHPEVIRIIKKKIRLSKAPVIVLDAPLLIEAGLKQLADKIIVVKTSRAQQLERAQKRTSLSRADILKRIRCQAPLRRKVRMADFVIDNSGTLEKTREQARKIWKSLARAF